MIGIIEVYRLFRTNPYIHCIVLAYCIGILHWHIALAHCIGTLHWHIAFIYSALACCVGTLHCSCIFVDWHCIALALHCIALALHGIGMGIAWHWHWHCVVGLHWIPCFVLNYTSCHCHSIQYYTYGQINIHTCIQIYTYKCIIMFVCMQCNVM